MIPRQLLAKQQHSTNRVSLVSDSSTPSSSLSASANESNTFIEKSPHKENLSIQSDFAKRIFSKLSMKDRPHENSNVNNDVVNRAVLFFGNGFRIKSDSRSYCYAHQLSQTQEKNPSQAAQIQALVNALKEAFKRQCLKNSDKEISEQEIQDSGFGIDLTENIDDDKIFDTTDDYDFGISQLPVQPKKNVLTVSSSKHNKPEKECKEDSGDDVDQALFKRPKLSEFVHDDSIDYYPEAYSGDFSEEFAMSTRRKTTTTHRQIGTKVGREFGEVAKVMKEKFDRQL